MPIYHALGKMPSKRHIVFEAIPVNDRQLESVIAAAQCVPDLAIVLNHLGRIPRIGDKELGDPFGNGPSGGCGHANPPGMDDVPGPMVNLFAEP